MTDTGNHSPSRRERPTSPHLSVYKPQITSITSITHRATGVFLLLGAFAYVWECFALVRGGKALECYMGFATSWVGLIFGTLFFLSLIYHLLNGIRHLAWDMGWGLELSTAKKTGWLVIITTPIIALTLLFIFFNRVGLL